MIQIIALFILSSSIFETKCNLYTCSRFSNCLCRDYYYVTLFCKIQNKLDILPELFHDLQNGSIIKHLQLRKCTAISLTNYIFTNASINEIDSNCPFEELEVDSLSNIDFLVSLQMRLTKFIKIPLAISKLRNLKYLRLIDGRLVTIGRELQNMTFLRALSFKGNNIETIASDAFLFNKYLGSLSITKNRIKFLHPRLFQHCPHLLHFKATNNYLNTTEDIPKGDFMEILLLDMNNLQVVKFHRYEFVTKLDVSGNPLLNLTDRAFHRNFPKLKSLEMQRCGLSVLPEHLLNTLFNLEYIDLSYNKIVRISSKFFQNLRQLRDVLLACNKLEYLEDSIFKDCQSITNVLLQKNRLKSLGTAFKDAKNLKKLVLSGNALEVLREEEFKYLTSLEYLSICDSQVTYLERNVFQLMKNLKVLRLNSNKISSLNHSLYNLRSVETVYLNNNHLDVISENDILGLVQLKFLYLAKNRLQNVNAAFSSLNNLRSLNLSKNKLKTLSITYFPQTRSLLQVVVSSNKWECDCRLLWFRDLLINRSVKIDGGPLYCNKPNKFQTRKLVDLSVSELVQGPYSYSCPPPCNCSCVDEEDGNYFVKVNCSGRNISEIPSILPERTEELDLNDNLLTTEKLKGAVFRNLKILHLERNFLISLEFDVPESIVVLKLAGNKLTRFFDEPPLNVSLWTLSQNPWICDCETRNFWKWMLQETNQILNIDDIRCGNDSSTRKLLHNKVIANLLDSDLCPSLISTIIIASVCILLLLLVGTSCSLTYSRYHYHMKVWLYSKGLTWLKKKDDDTHVKEYDAFISSADEDFFWVYEFLLPEFEKRCPYYRIYEPRLHMLCGEMFTYVKEMEEARKSRRVIVLLSKNYIKNNFLMEVFKSSFATSLEEKKIRLIIISIGDLPPLSDIDQGLKAAIESTRCLKIGQRLFWEMLIFAMPKQQQNIDANNSDDMYDDIPLLQ